jgi:hypothetical protein
MNGVPFPGVANMTLKQLRVRSNGAGLWFAADADGNVTPPVGRKWCVWSKMTNNWNVNNQAQATFWEVLRLGGVDYRTTSTMTLTYNSSYVMTEGMILENGMQRGVQVSGNDVNHVLNCFEFDDDTYAESFIKTVYVPSVSIGDNVLYTVPENKSALMLPVNTNPFLFNSTPQLAGMNTVTATVTYYVYMLRAGQVPGIDNLFDKSANQSGVNKISLTTYWEGNAGDSLVLHVTTATAFPWWFNVWEF